MIRRSAARFRSIFPLAVFEVLAVAALLRFWALGKPATLVFDELYYVRDAITQLSFGFPTSWPDDDPAMGMPFTSEAEFAVHPPLGKWLIGLGMLVFGTDNGWGWRSSVALFGVATVALTMRLSWRISRNHLITFLAGLFLAIDGVHIVLSRVALLDGFLAFFTVLGALFMWRDHEWVVQRGGPRRRVPSARGVQRTRPVHGTRGLHGTRRLQGTSNSGTQSASSATRALPASPVFPVFAGFPVFPILPVLVWRPWLIAAAITFGCAASVKWSGLYPLAGFLVLTTVRDLVVRLRLARAMRRHSAYTREARRHESHSHKAHKHGSRGQLRALAAASLQALTAALLTLPLTVAVYIANWAGWIFTSDGWGRNDAPGGGAADGGWIGALWQYHLDMFAWHSTLNAPHPYGAHPLTWPLGLRPTAMFKEDPSTGIVSAISPLPNLLITWGGVIALLVLVWWITRILRRASSQAQLLPRSSTARTVIRLGGGPPWLRSPDQLVTAYGAAFIVTGYLSGWLPWVLTVSRSAVFQFYAVVLTPFSAIALALVLAAIYRANGTDDERFGRRVAIGIFVGIAVVISALFFPEWSGIPVPDWFWRAHMWLPGWA